MSERNLGDNAVIRSAVDLPAWWNTENSCVLILIIAAYLSDYLLPLIMELHWCELNWIQSGAETSSGSILKRAPRSLENNFPRRTKIGFLKIMPPKQGTQSSVLPARGVSRSLISFCIRLQRSTGPSRLLILIFMDWERVREICRAKERKSKLPLIPMGGSPN